MRTFRSSALGLALLSAAFAGACGAQRIPLHRLWNEQETDSAYTVSDERRDRLVREQGYVDMGVVAYVEAKPAPHARPLVCYYFASPRTDTLCTISALEQRVVRATGYVEVGVEGYVYDSRVEGSVPLYRVSRVHGEGGDYEHRFVISSGELVRLRRQGWRYDGAKGYVFPAP